MCFTGRERCYRVQWESLPEVQDAAADLSGEQPAEATFRKDANEVLMKDGPQALRFCIDQAEPLPIRGLFRSGFPPPSRLIISQPMLMNPSQLPEECFAQKQPGSLIALAACIYHKGLQLSQSTHFLTPVEV